MTYYGLLTPSGIVVPMGKKRPKLSKEMRREYWKVMRVRLIKKESTNGASNKRP